MTTNRGRGGVIDNLRRFRRWGPQLIVLTVVSMGAAVLEASALVLLGPLAQLISDDADTYSGELGPFEIQLSRGGLGALALALVVAALGANIAVARLSTRMGAAYESSARSELMSAYLGTTWERQALDREGRIQTYFTGFIALASRALGSLVALGRAAISLVILFVTAFAINPAFAASAVAMAVVLLAVTRPFVTRTRRYHLAAARLDLEQAEQIEDLVTLTRDIRVFGVRHRVREQLDRAFVDIAEVRAQAGVVSTVSSAVYQTLGLCLIIGTLLLAPSFGAVSIASLGAVALLLLRSVSYGQQVQAGLQRLAESAPYVDRLDEVLRDYAAHAEPVGTNEIPSIETVQLSDVWYRYPTPGSTHATDDDATGDAPDDHEWALACVDLVLRRGEMVGIVGPSGSGKSTLAQLLLGLRLPSKGDILVNDLPLHEINPEAWSREATFVPQECRLVHATVRDNIAFRRDLPEDRVIEAARRAGIHDAICALPHGYDTPIGPSTRDLSGGQRQRIAVARALAGRPSLVVLDEPTSALDDRAEAIVKRSLQDLGRGVTRVVIAHRLTTLELCERIIVMRDGTIEADGSMSDAAAASPFLDTALRRGRLDDAPER